MDFAGGPAALGGIIMFSALAAWSLGRWQGGLAPPAAAPLSELPGSGEAGSAPQPESLSDPAPALCQNAARAELRVALAAAPSLHEVHAEITAYRNAEQVLSRSDETMLRLVPLTRANEAGCRFIGLTGEPTCCAPRAARAACADGILCANALPPRAAASTCQPSPGFPDVSRV